jgi:hypothetical protein
VSLQRGLVGNQTVWVATGSVADLNALLLGAQLTPLANFNGSLTLSFDINDQGNSGFGGAMSQQMSISLLVKPVDDATTWVTGTKLNGVEDTSVTLGLAAPQLSDVDAFDNMMQVSVLAPNGVFMSDSGNTNSLTLSGTLQQINLALQLLSYQPRPNQSGVVSVELTHASAGSAIFEIDLQAVNDSPLANFTDQTALRAQIGTQVSSGLRLGEGLQLIDVDDEFLYAAQIQIADGYIAGDQLTLLGSDPRIQTRFDSSTGTLYLLGQAPVQVYESLLQSSVFLADGSSLVPRSIEFWAQDATLRSNVVNRSVTVATIVAPPYQPPVVQPFGNPTATSGTQISPITPVVVTEIQASASPLSPANSVTTPSGAPVNNSPTKTEADASVAANAVNRNGNPNGVGTRQRRDVENSDKVAVESKEIAIVAFANNQTEQRAREQGIDLVISSLIQQLDNGRSENSGTRFEVLKSVQSAQLLQPIGSATLTIPSVKDGVNEAIPFEKTNRFSLDLDSLTFQNGGLVVSAVALWWLTRTGGLITALLTALPSWSHFDPLPILGSTDDRQDKDEEQNLAEDKKHEDALA